MKQIGMKLQHCAGDTHWLFPFCRCIFMLFLGVLTALKPAAALYLCTLLFPLSVFLLLLYLTSKLRSAYCRLLWLCLIPVAALLVFPRNCDMAAAFFAALAAVLNGIKAWRRRDISCRIMAAAAMIAGSVLFIKSIPSNWFSLYPAAGMLFFALGAWECGNMHFSFFRKN